MKQIAIICFSDAGALLAEKIRGAVTAENITVHSTPSFAQKYAFTPHESVKADMKALFSQNDALIFICATGIAVRLIAPFVKDKTRDPAVVVADDGGNFVISLLSGHIGGANALTGQVSAAIGARPVITTATDVAGRFSCDSWAAINHCAISSMPLAKRVSSEILKKDIPITSERPLPALLPKGVYEGDSGECGILIGIHKKEPFQNTLRLIPRVLTLGIGCRKGSGKEAIAAAVETVFEKYDIDVRAVSRIVTIDVKKDEAGLLSYARDLQVPAVFYTAEELRAVPGEFEESAFVKNTVGVGNVCERAALYDGGKLCIKKTALSGVTIAAALREWSISF